MASIIGATLVKTEIDANWPLTDESVPLGKCYLVDIDRIETGLIFNLVDGRFLSIDMIFVVEPVPSGWLPLLMLKLDTHG